MLKVIAGIKASWSTREAAPHAVVCCFAICAETAAEAEKLAACVDLRRLQMQRISFLYYY